MTRALQRSVQISQELFVGDSERTIDAKARASLPTSDGFEVIGPCSSIYARRLKTGALVCYLREGLLKYVPDAHFHLYSELYIDGERRLNLGRMDLPKGSLVRFLGRHQYFSIVPVRG